MGHTHIHRGIQDRGLKPAENDLPMHVSANDRQEVVVLRARPRCGAHTLEWRLFETVAREWKQLFSLSHSSFISILLLLIFLTVSYVFSFFSPCSLVFSISLFLWPRLFFFPQSFPFPLSLPLSLAFGLFTAYFDAQPISCQHGPCRRSAKGYFLRLQECVCVWAALIFYLRQVHISPVRCAGLQQDRDCGALTRKQLHLCSFHSLCRLTNVQAHFPQECKSSRYTVEIILPKQSHTHIYRRG